MLTRARKGQAWDMEGVLRYIKSIRSRANPNKGFLKQLKAYELKLDVLFGSSKDVKTTHASAAVPITTKHVLPLAVRLNRLISMIKFAFVALRPIMLYSTLLYCAIQRVRKKYTSYGGLVFTAILIQGLFKDDVFRANLLGRLGRAQAGVYYRTQNRVASSSNPTKATVIEEMLEKCPAIRLGYAEPWWSRLLGGDVVTLAFLLARFEKRHIVFARENVPCDAPFLRQGHSFSLDWVYPVNPFTAQNVCLMLSGIGGDSDSAYVRCVAQRMLEEGFAVSVLLARGLGTCTGAVGLDGVYNAADDSDVDRAVRLLAERYRKVVVIGFSLGGITTCRYFSNFAHKMPKNVVAGIAISGGFKVDFISNPRYEQVYQKMLVPRLVDDIISKYSGEITELSRVLALQTSLTYKEIHEHLYVGLNIPNVDKSFIRWKQKLGSDPSVVDRPLMIVTALDDPLHHPLMLGLNWFFNNRDRKGSEIDFFSTRRERPPSENVVALVTTSGGHVSWAEPGFGNDGYAFLRNIVGEFAQAAVNRKV